MKILSIDTSSKICSISIIEANDNNFEILVEHNSNDEKKHSQKLMPIIKYSFDETNLTLDNIDLIAVCVGPGSFTGIRIGVSTAKAFSDAKNIPIIGITSLESLVYNVSNSGIIIPIIDAKNSNAYSAVFSHEKDYNLEHENIADNINAILDKFISYINTDTNIYFVGDGAILNKKLINQKYQNSNIYFSDNNLQSSVSLANAAYKKYSLGKYGYSNTVSPIYLRKSQAERMSDGEK